jgi:hypothetical protein
MSLADRMNNAYIRTIFNDTFLVSGTQYMPFKAQVDKETRKAVNAFGLNVYPVLLALGMPVFLNSMVLEREQRLMQNMKINGLQMKYYWLVSAICNFAFYIVQAAVYFFYGKHVAQLSFFIESSAALLWITFIGWGLCQISLAFAYSSFFNQQQSAQIVGYTLAIVGSCLCTSLMMAGGVYDENKEMFWWLRLHPTPNFARILYIIADNCAWRECDASVEGTSDELKTCLKCLYANAVVYFILALYFE